MGNICCCNIFDKFTAISWHCVFSENITAQYDLNINTTVFQANLYHV